MSEYDKHVERRARALKDAFFDSTGSSASQFWVKQARATMEADRAAGCDIPEMQARISELEADVAALREALEKACALDIGRPVPRNADEAYDVEIIIAEQDRAREYIREIARAALAVLEDG